MPERLRILILAQGYPCAANPVAGAFHAQQFACLAEQGIELTVVVPVPWVPPGVAARNARWAAYAALPAFQQEASIAIHRPRYLAVPGENKRGIPDVMQYWAVRRHLARIGYKRPDLIHAFFALPTGAVARKLAGEMGVPYSFSALGDDVNIYPYLNRRNMRLLRGVIDDAALVVSNGPTLSAAIKRLSGRSAVTLSIGVSEARFAKSPAKSEARARLGLPEDRFIALYVGGHTPPKGTAELAMAVDLVARPDFLLLTLGDGPLKADLAARSNVRCLGAQPAAEVNLAMAAADLLVHPSHYEGLPTVLVEAGLAGLPILTTDAPGCRDIAEGGRALMVPVNDAAALAAAINSVMEDRQGAKCRVSAMEAHLREQYILEKNTAALAAHWGIIAGGPR